MAAPVGFVQALRAIRDRLLGVSAYEPPKGYGPSLDDKAIEEGRKSVGGNLQPIPYTQLRWYLADLELAQAEADAGNLTRACQLYRAMRRDGVLMGLLSTRTKGLVGLPKKFTGPDEIVKELTAEVIETRSVFDEMCPPSEIESLIADGDVIGAGVAELVPVRGREYPVMVRLDPEWLQYIWPESRWYYVTRLGRIPITPGDGRWVLHVPGGRTAPWQWGLWPALGRAFIMKEHAISLRGAFIAGVANPAKVLSTPLGSNESFRKAMFQHVLQWGPNMAVEMPPGWKLELLEMVGRAWEVFQREIDTCDLAYMVALAGQVVTTTGGTGFSNSDVQRVIRGDLLAGSANAISYTLTTQVLPQFVARRFGVDAIERGTSVWWNTKAPKDLEAEARTMTGVGAGIDSVNKAVAPYGREVDIAQIAARFGLPLRDRKPRLELVDETREQAA